MRTTIPSGSGRFGPFLAFALALSAAAADGQTVANSQTAAAGQPVADDSPQSPCDGCFSQGYEPMPAYPWYFSTEGIALQRLYSGLGPAATLGLGSSGAVALSQQDLGTPFEPGVRMLIGHTLGDTPYQVEMSYFWLAPWDTSAQVIDPQRNLYSLFVAPFGLPPNPAVEPNSVVAIHQISRLEDGQINVKYTLPLPEGDPTVMLLVGVRHVGVREEFDYTSQTMPTANPVSVRAHTNNNLWGPQIGAVVDFGGWYDAWLRFEGTAALCDNEYNRDLQADVNGITATHPRFLGSNTAETADISATIMWRPLRALTAKIGYQAFWCDQLALAERNFAPDLGSLTNPAVQPSINARGTLIYHGPFAGLQVNW